MGILIDSSVLIEWERGQIDLSEYALGREEEVFLSAITASELLHDSWIAATCLAHGLSLATNNLREFRRVPGLTVDVWA